MVDGRAGEGDCNAFAVHRLGALVAENEELRTDIAQLRLQAADLSKSDGEMVAAAFLPAGEYRTHQDVVSGISFGGGVIATCSWDASVRTFDLVAWKEGQSMRVGSGDGGLAKDIAFLAVARSPCVPQVVACTSRDTRTRVWNMESNMVQGVAGHVGEVNAVDFHPSQDSVMCTASDDRRAILWDYTSFAQVRTLAQHMGEVTSARFLEGPEYERSIVTGCTDRHVRLWDLRMPSLQYALLAPADRHVALAPCTPNHLLAAGTDQSCVVAWDLRMLRLLHKLELSTHDGFEDGVASLAFSPCGSYLALGSPTGTVFVLDLECRVRRPVCRHRDAVSCLCWGAPWPWRPDGVPFLLCASHDGTWSCWTPPADASQSGEVGVTD